MFNNEIDFIEYNIDIYINQINNYACLISSKNNYTFSVINYDNKKLLDKIEIKQNEDVYNLTLYDNNGLKYHILFILRPSTKISKIKSIKIYKIL